MLRFYHTGFDQQQNHIVKLTLVKDADRVAQDTYDLFMAHGIDISCFAVPGEDDRML